MSLTPRESGDGGRSPGALGGRSRGLSFSRALSRDRVSVSRPSSRSLLLFSLRRGSSGLNFSTRALEGDSDRRRVLLGGASASGSASHNPRCRGTAGPEDNGSPLDDLRSSLPFERTDPSVGSLPVGRSRPLAPPRRPSCGSWGCGGRGAAPLGSPLALLASRSSRALSLSASRSSRDLGLSGSLPTGCSAAGSSAAGAVPLSDSVGVTSLLWGFFLSSTTLGLGTRAVYSLRTSPARRAMSARTTVKSSSVEVSNSSHHGGTDRGIGLCRVRNAR